MKTSDIASLPYARAFGPSVLKELQHDLGEIKSKGSNFAELKQFFYVPIVPFAFLY